MTKINNTIISISAGIVIGMALIILDFSGCADWGNNASTPVDTIQPNINIERYNYEDSSMRAINAILLDSIKELMLKQEILDTELDSFIHKKNKIYEAKVNRVQYASAEDILRMWADRYDTGR